MRVAVLSGSGEWIALVSGLFDRSGHKLAVLGPDLKWLSTPPADFDLIFIDLDAFEESTRSNNLRNLRETLGWDPLFMCSSSGNSLSREDFMSALSIGADDFLENASDTTVLRAKLSAIARRRYFQSVRPKKKSCYVVNADQKLVLVNGAAVKLNDKEFGLFMLLYGNINLVFDREEIYECVWSRDESAVQTRTLDTHVSRLRKRLSLDGSYGLRIRPVYGVGYVMETAAHGGG